MFKKYGNDEEIIYEPIHPVLKRALTKYGIKEQSLIAVEEMSELTKELIKNHRGKPNEDQIAEEVADVLITLDQVIEGYGIAGDVERWIDFKINRLEERMNNEKSVL